jgi:hypothetical protein
LEFKLQLVFRPVRQLSLAPGFSRVVLAALAGNGFNRFGTPSR